MPVPQRNTGIEKQNGGEGIMKKLIGAICIICGLNLLSGCAGYKINDDGSASSWGFLRTLTVQHEYYPDGKLKTRNLSTQSNTADVMMGANELLKTGVDTAAKLKP